MTDLDLTPREGPASASRSWRNWVIMGVLALVAGVVLYQALTSARVYFLNVDEAVSRRAELGDDAFNMQGTVISEPTMAADGAMLFTVTFGGEDAEIRHIGDEPTDLFGVGEPVVAKGRWDGDVFVSEQVLIKHSEEYIEENPDHVNYEIDGTGEAPDDGSDGSSTGTGESENSLAVGSAE
ncbi:MAG: cytochrome c maturation protein CcmE [Acidimicrobiia bacterium]|nr:cytochrome c maturation protein CcmE [Acidimicrobiia bacterium]